MADEKSQPTTFVITTPQAQEEQPKKSGRLTRKHILIAAVTLTIAVLVVVVILVAIRMNADHETLKLKYSMEMKDKDNQNVNQNVSADANANIVQYDIQKDGLKATILHDFDKGIAVSRVESESGVVCYLAALNRSNAQEPTEIPSTTPKPDDNTPTTQLVYKVDNRPIKDLSFLGKRSSTLCANVPTHWMIPSCDGDETGLSNSTTTPAPHDRRKRATYGCATCGGYYCVCGCCNAICGSFASYTYTWYYSNGVYYCTYYMYYVSCRVYLGPTCILNGRNYYYPWS
jgi:cell division protein FtsL